LVSTLYQTVRTMDLAPLPIELCSVFPGARRLVGQQLDELLAFRSDLRVYAQRAASVGPPAIPPT
jgi:hypothetical protein